MERVPLRLVVILAVVAGVRSQSKVVQSEDGTAGTIKFSTPSMDDDEAHSPWMPDMLKCDACRAVAFSIWKKFTEYNMKRRSFNYDLPESEILDLTEEVCENDKTWESYGMKEVNKQKRLSGPGMETADTPGVTAGGGKWPSRLGDMCNSYMGELGELSIYKVYFKNPKSRKRFEDFLCRGPGIRSECTDATVEKRKPPPHVLKAELEQLEKEKREFEMERKAEKKQEAKEKKRKERLRKEKRDAKLREKEERERLRKELGEEQPAEEAKRMEEEKKAGKQQQKENEDPSKGGSKPSDESKEKDRKEKKASKSSEESKDKDKDPKEKKTVKPSEERKDKVPKEKKREPDAGKKAAEESKEKKTDTSEEKAQDKKKAAERKEKETKEKVKKEQKETKEQDEEGKQEKKKEDKRKQEPTGKRDKSSKKTKSRKDKQNKDSPKADKQEKKGKKARRKKDEL